MSLPDLEKLVRMEPEDGAFCWLFVGDHSVGWAMPAQDQAALTFSLRLALAPVLAEVRRQALEEAAEICTQGRGAYDGSLAADAENAVCARIRFHIQNLIKLPFASAFVEADDSRRP